MKRVLCLIIITSFFCCNLKKTDQRATEASKYAETITLSDLKKHLYIYASDEFEGRETGEIGQKKAITYLREQYVSRNIKSPLGNGNYFQEISSEYLSNNRRNAILKKSENVVAYIQGKEKPEEIIVLSAHLDHLGNKFGKIYNGADDDGSGNVALLEIAEAFKKAANEGIKPRRSILFLHFTAEEKGLLGSKYYSENPIFPLKNTVADLNIDMIGRVDDKHINNKNYIYLIGTNRISTELHNISELVNKKHTNINLDYTYNDKNDPNRFYYRSDHYNFAKYNIPVIFYFNGTHEDYHKPSDTPDKIDYELLTQRTKLVFYTAWELANRKERLKIDKK